MEIPGFIIIGLILAVLSILTIMLMKVSSEEEETISPKLNAGSKFQPGNITFSHCTPETEKPKRKYKKKRKKKPAVPSNGPVEKRPVGRPKKSN